MDWKILRIEDEGKTGRKMRNGGDMRGNGGEEGGRGNIWNRLNKNSIT